MWDAWDRTLQGKIPTHTHIVLTPQPLPNPLNSTLVLRASPFIYLFCFCFGPHLVENLTALCFISGLASPFKSAL